MTLKKRAYSDEEKHQREQMIIDAAQHLLMEKSFHNINMSEVARTAKLAKGTVYLYFQTKEELFLTLFVRQFGVWLDNVEAGLKALGDQIDTADVVKIIVDNTVANKQLIRLTALANIMFEHNISYEKIREYKFWLHTRVSHLGTTLEELLQLQPSQGFVIMYRLYIFVIGLENVANPAPVAKKLYAKEPGLFHPDFETELTALMTLVIDALYI